MKYINGFLSCPDHCKQTGYLLEFKLCRMEGFRVCQRMLRVTGLGNDGLSKKVTSCCALPQLNDSGNEFLSIEKRANNCMTKSQRSKKN